MRTPTERRRLWALLATALVVAVAWWFLETSAAPEPVDGSGLTSQGEASDDPTADMSTDSATESDTDPESGLPWVSPDDLPAEAGETIGLIEQGGPFPYRCCDDTTFRNDEGLLPDEPRGYYREYTVETPGSHDRGARRIVVGDRGEFYWTDDHYESFSRIVMDHDGDLP